MPNIIAEQLLDEKKKKSQYLTLADGETIKAKIVSMKKITKVSYNGDEVDVLRMELAIQYPDIGIVKKWFDNGSMKWIGQVVEKNISIGDNVQIGREGEQNKTSYTIDTIDEDSQNNNTEEGTVE